MSPVAWLVTWQARGAEPAGSARYTVRREARGFYMIRRAMGFAVTIDPVWS